MRPAAIASNVVLNGSFVTLSAAQHSDSSAVGRTITTTAPIR